MSPAPGQLNRPDRSPLESEDFLRRARQIGIGLLFMAMFVDAGAKRLLGWRTSISGMRRRMLMDIEASGSMLADIATELLNATDSARRAP